MDSESQNENGMLTAAQAEGTQVAVFLVNGIRLVGQVEAFDRYMVLLRSAAGTQAIYKHAISTVQQDTGRAPMLERPRDAGESARNGGTKRTSMGMQKRAAVPRRETE
jgi:host factor-I protein